jgi:hypothetical protein
VLDFIEIARRIPRPLRSGRKPTLDDTNRTRWQGAVDNRYLYDVSESESADQKEKHTLIHIICDSCDEEDLLTILEHPRNAGQTRAIADIHHTIAEEHADETDHHIEVGETEDDPDSIIELAKAIAPSVGGVEPEDFSEEYAELH